jgi:hypothetical protein
MPCLEAPHSINIKMISLKSEIAIGPKARLFLAGSLPWVIGVVLFPIVPPIILSAPFFSGYFIMRYGGRFLIACSPTALMLLAMWVFAFHSGASGDAAMGVFFGVWYFTLIVVATGLLGPAIAWWRGRDAEDDQKWRRRA